METVKVRVAWKVKFMRKFALILLPSEQGAGCGLYICCIAAFAHCFIHLMR